MELTGAVDISSSVAFSVRPRRGLKPRPRISMAAARAEAFKVGRCATLPRWADASASTNTREKHGGTVDLLVLKFAMRRAATAT